MDAIELLTSQHRRAENLFREVEAAPLEPKHRLFLDLADLLVLHAALEERIFYPAVYEQRTQEVLIAALDQHMVIKRALADLLRATPASQGFDAKLKLLDFHVARHVADEEQDLFPVVVEIRDRRQLEALAQLMSGTMGDLEDPELRRAVTIESGP
jgi:hypothetical protein